MTSGSGVLGQDSAGFEPAPSHRPVELALARAHLRLGSLALARAELEILAAAGALDMPGHVDLAEVRWRTGDLTGAGEAAAAALGAGEDQPVALVIAAEAAAALGRPNEARRLANDAMEHMDGSIDALFAGMPRSGVWPTDAAEPPPTAGTLFHQGPAPVEDRRAGDTDPNATASRAPVAGERAEASGVSPLTLGFWDPDGGSGPTANELPDPAGELEAARAALIAGSLDDAILCFALVLRLAPALAPAVLEATDGVSGTAVHVVRGDAFRLVGLESEARRAYAAAAWSGSRDRRSKGQDDTAAPSADEHPAAQTQRPTADDGAPEPDPPVEASAPEA